MFFCCPMRGNRQHRKKNTMMVSEPNLKQGNCLSFCSQAPCFHIGQKWILTYFINFSELKKNIVFWNLKKNYLSIRITKSDNYKLYFYYPIFFIIISYSFPILALEGSDSVGLERSSRIISNDTFRWCAYD